MFELIVTLGDRQVQKYRGSGDVVSIGRDPGCDVVLDNLGVSRRHAEIRQIEGRYVLADKGSTNGVYIGDRRVTSTELSAGDTFRIAKFSLKFRPVEQEAPESFDINQTIAMSTEDLGTAVGATEEKPAFVASVTRDVFHRKGCAWIKATPDDHKVWFSSAQEAWDSGRRACKTCDPAAAEPSDAAGKSDRTSASDSPGSPAEPAAPPSSSPGSSPRPAASGAASSGPSTGPSAPPASPGSSPRPASSSGSPRSASPGGSPPPAPSSSRSGGRSASTPSGAPAKPAAGAAGGSRTVGSARDSVDDPDATRPATSRSAPIRSPGTREPTRTPEAGHASKNDSETVLVERASLSSSRPSSDASDEDDGSSGSETKPAF